MRDIPNETGGYHQNVRRTLSWTPRLCNRHNNVCHTQNKLEVATKCGLEPRYSYQEKRASVVCWLLKIDSYKRWDQRIPVAHPCASIKMPCDFSTAWQALCTSHFVHRILILTGLHTRTQNQKCHLIHVPLSASLFHDFKESRLKKAVEADLLLATSQYDQQQTLAMHSKVWRHPESCFPLEIISVVLNQKACHGMSHVGEVLWVNAHFLEDLPQSVLATGAFEPLVILSAVTRRQGFA